MDIRVLRYFLAIIKEGGITQAANSLHLTQPTISRQIKELEEELGKQLFIRHKKGQIELTQEGRLLQNRAEEIIAMVDKTENDFRYLTDKIEGDIYIGGAESYIFSHIATIAKQLQKEYPKIRYHLSSGNAEDMTALLDKGLLDFALVVHPRQLPHYHYQKLPSQDIWGIILPKTDKLAQKTSIRLEDIQTLPLIVSRQALTKTHSDNQLITWLGDLNQLTIITTFNLSYNALFMVEAGLGYMIGFDHLTYNPNLTFRPLDPLLTSDHYLVWKKGKVFSAAAQLFLEKLQG
ncbi:LysR family transcriptional regulator [Streptococcus sp. S784/96/1]|uniref:LysR family transcriptional regulator n=1 Tax=Streptococcus sp. S784/96/1 TaxID=2653499 RepID=UPI0013873F0C|nr:LysR family transcriptional regulator [Streptococcus sp. S784/96/1]